ncbi:MAG: hypothetical protein E7261_12085 [Lachnospiraceae bacterium]|nr:hypothetical protein [Lachnospiraceae bacterium]
MKKFRTGLLIVLFLVAGLLFYAYLSDKDGTDQEVTKEATEISKLLSKDLTKEYPETPREIVKLYSRITVCFYDEEHTDEEIGKLADMSLMLFDNELLEKNPKNEYLVNLKAVIDEYASTEKIITDYTVQSSNMIDKYTVDGVDYAKVRVMYSMRDFKLLEDKDTGFLSGCGTGARKNKEYRYYTTYEDFLLRKDENGKWKILVWQVPEMEGMDGGDE